MAQFSAFAPFGLFTFGREPSPAEGPYQQLKDAYCKLYNMTAGASYKEALCYATAITIGSVRATIARTENEEAPLRCWQKLPTLERDYGVIPSPSDDLDTRRANLHARELLMAGSREESITTELTTLLGAALLKYRVTTIASVIKWPASPGAIGAWQSPSIAPKFFTVLDSIDAIIGTPTTRTTRLSPINNSDAPIVGEVYCFEPTCNVVAEAVTLTAVATTWNVTATFTKAHAVGAQLLMAGLGTLLTFTLKTEITSSMLNKAITVQVSGSNTSPTGSLIIDNDSSSAETVTATAAALWWTVTGSFSRPHSAGAVARTNMPMWTSTQREVQIIVTQAAARSAETARKIGVIMRRHMKSTARWRIVEQSTTGNVGPWTVKQAIVGATGLGHAAQPY